jgi:hypothetical protein
MTPTCRRIPVKVRPTRADWRADARMATRARRVLPVCVCVCMCVCVDGCVCVCMCVCVYVCVCVWGVWEGGNGVRAGEYAYGVGIGE